MKRSEHTYLRKLAKVPNLTYIFFNEITKEHLFRYNNAHSTFEFPTGKDGDWNRKI